MSFFKIFFKPKNERRRSPRAESKDLVKVDFQADGPKQISAIGVGEDISMTGIRFATFAPLKKGQVLDAALHFFQLFPGNKRVAVQIKIIRVYKPFGSRRYRIGGEFIQSSANNAEFEALAAFIAWLKKQSS